MDPRPDGSRHVEPGGGVQGKDLTGTLLSGSPKKHVLVELLRLPKEFLDATIELLSKDTKVINKAVLSVGMVLKP